MFAFTLLAEVGIAESDVTGNDKGVRQLWRAAELSVELKKVAAGFALGRDQSHSRHASWRRKGAVIDPF
ncbi:hypothetical protein SERLA73DRAFT_185181 [Serpula lacrymans var. lacrymans S7.3]|uniref:Uncharacterized protein n=2 Tax=Serpula lacrymans var. lacrymans TaxID=341189 RepID=F8Q479_SERL3|nr:uncharacterized protein SERLADRAFT_473485 [Serpula lacrymans var. lacrymans S7.9]EGN96935.1 hypothetical protein SERLA73DRAFT_185181 [Serpula lacrymans var. lacrymans S7.3]EGO22528.1 hypothetical protein SERLADRAFT_473485 [Serpula lacrymans var. lacrymans S7.9]